MALNLATLNARGLGDPSKWARLLCELSTLSVNVAAVQETHFTCAADCGVRENNYVVLSAYGSRSSIGVSLLIGRSLNADVNLVLADDGGWLVVANVAVKSFEFRVTAFFALNIGSPSVRARSYLDRVLEELTDFVKCSTFLYITWTYHRLVKVCLRLAGRPSLADYWKFNTSSLEIQDFRDRLESLVQRALMGAVAENKW